MKRQQPSTGGFLLDANIYIEAQNRYYALDICPGFWKALKHHELGSIEKVKGELENPVLNAWVRENLPDRCFPPTDEPEVVKAFARLMKWVQSKNYLDRAKAEFASAADGWLIAYAMVHDRIVVTHEASAPDSKKRVMIPDVCREFGVKYVNTFEMLRALQVRFSMD